MILNLFPTPVSYIKNFLDADEIKLLFDYCLGIKEVDSSSLVLDDAVTSHKEHKDFLFEAMSAGDIPSELYKKLLKELIDYSRISGYGFSKIANSWFNIQNKGSVLRTHLHPQSLVSGAMYINVDENSSPIYLYNPNTLSEFACVSDTTEHGYKWAKFIPENGDLLLFPSWLRHGSHNEQNQTPNRLVISFNTVF